MTTTCPVTTTIVWTRSPETLPTLVQETFDNPSSELCLIIFDNGTHGVRRLVRTFADNDSWMPDGVSTDIWIGEEASEPAWWTPVRSLTTPLTVRVGENQ